MIDSIEEELKMLKQDLAYAQKIGDKAAYGDIQFRIEGLSKVKK